jgi:thiol-disulfide isomerase/thioredoxin
MKLRLAILYLLGFALSASAAEAKIMDDLKFEELRGTQLEQSAAATPEIWRGHSTLVMFWRSDCAPCLREIEILPDIAKQNADLPIALISLHDTEHTRAHLTPMPDNVRILVAQDDGKRVLAAFGNDRTLALPYSVMLNSSGAICNWYYGIIAPEKVIEWKKACS